MKRSTLFLLTAVAAVALLAAIAYAQQLGGSIDPASGLEIAGGPPPEGRERALMGWVRMGQPAIAVSGSHVYVVSGGLLLEYDQDLNLTNQVELPRPERPASVMGGGRMGRRGGGGGAGGRRAGGSGGMGRSW